MRPNTRCSGPGCVRRNRGPKTRGVWPEVSRLAAQQSIQRDLPHDRHLRLELYTGRYALDAGCGPGLLTTRIAAAVSPNGRVLAVDIQPGMIAKAQERAFQAGLSNVDFLVAPLGSGELPSSHFDRVLLVTVLGEIPDKVAALKEIASSLKPGGFVSITEVLPDPHYQSFRRIALLAEEVGLLLRNKVGNAFMFTVNLEKPLGD